MENRGKRGVHDSLSRNYRPERLWPGRHSEDLIAWNVHAQELFWVVIEISKR